MAGVKGKGHKFSHATVAETPSYTELGQVRDITGPNITVASIDTTHAGSDAIEKMPGFLDGGDVTVELLFDKAQGTTVEGMLETTKMFKITLSDGSTWEFTGFVSALGTASPYQDAVTQSMTIAISGKPEYTAAS